MSELPASSNSGKNESEPSKWTFGLAALFLIGLTSIISQLVAAAAFGVWGQIAPSWTTGGLLAVGGAVLMVVNCKTWADFRRRIWIWLAATVAIAGYAIGTEASAFEPFLGQ